MGRCPNQPKPRITILNFWIEKMAGSRLAATTVLLLLLCWSTHQVDAQEPLTVVITVSYTPPPGFTLGPNEYRAASGPVVVTCTATEGAGIGNYDYVWTSTCSGCDFITSSSEATSVITRTAVHSGDTGTHTCTATRGGESASDSITLNVVGYGIFVVVGTNSSSATAAAGSLPNNGLVIATTGGGTFLRFFGRSDSMMENVGEILGLDGTAISSGGRFAITHPQLGEIQAINGATQGALPSNEQGVYTLRIPDSTNATRNINVGVYINGFNTIPSIANPLVFTSGLSSSTLTCTSTGSVATTVTFMRDSTTVGPLRDGESIELDGVTYQLTQTVTDRAASTYENMLSIDQPLVDIVGSNFTCSVENTVGMSPTSEILPIMAVIIGYEPVLYSVNESDTTGMVDVTIRLLQGDLTGLTAIPVNVSAANFTATDGSDFSFAPLTLQFDETNTEFTLTVSIMNDDVTEGSEVFFMLAQSSDDRVQIIPDRANVTIIDEDAVTIGFLETDVTVEEAAGPAILNVALLSGSLERDVFVDFATQDGTAVAPADYANTVRVLSFGPSSVVNDPVAVPVNITADDLLETDETFSASLTPVPSSLITEILPSLATVTIDDDDQVQIGFDPDSYTVSEEDGSATLTVRLASELLERDVEVRFMTENDVALAGEDYSVTDETLTFSSTVNELTVTVPIISDTAFEIQERFVGNLTLLSTDADVNVSPSLASIFIDDNDALTIGFNPVAYSANEDMGMVTLTVGVQGQLGPGTTVSVDYRLLDDTAVVDDDYVMISGQLMFTSTNLSHSIQVQIINDETVEMDEVFLGNLFGGPVDPRFTLSPENATVTIVNDDDPPTVSITVNGPPPPGFTPGGPDEYRAASGGYTFICTASGGAGNGDYQYVWTSTCQPSCEFQTSSNGARSEIFRQALHSGDSGTHTCTATREGQSASDSIDITIVGVGIFVFTGSGVTGAQPNNGLVISTNPGSGRRFRFFCRSDSLTIGVGQLFGLDGSPVNTSSFFGFPTATNGGELRVENDVDSEDALTANEQGVYTCRIPLEGGGEGEINIGVYPSGFSTDPNISNPLMFALGSSSSTLTCTSTASVATTVTFIRDGTTVGPLRDGESMDFGAVTYQLAQTVTNRSQSSYQNVLAINQPLADIVGSTFTCSVENRIGTSPVSQPFTIMAIEITSPPQIPTVGDTATFTCTSLLGQADTIEWLLVDGSEMSAGMDSGQTSLDLVFDPVSESMNGAVYRCRVTIGGTTVDQDVTVTVEAPNVTVLITTSGSAVVGMSYNLTCTVSGADNLGGTISIAFTGPNSSGGVGTSLQLPLGTLDLNDAGRYTCTATVTSTLLSDDLVSTDTEDINIPIPSPAVNVSGPSGLYFATTNLTLTCTIEIASALGSVAVTAMWIGPLGMLTGTDPVTGGSNLIYESMLTIESLPTTSTATYTCIAMVDAAPSSEFVTASMETGILEIPIVLAPTAPVIMTPTPRTDSIMITWNQASEDVVVNYEISYVYDGTCPNVPVSSPVTLNSTTTSYEVSDLEEFSTYTITVTAINPAGTTDATVTATTMIATPDAAPSSVMTTVMDSTNISVQWEEVPCLQQNSIITGYTVRYEPASGGEPSNETITGTNTMASLTNLQPFTNYLIQVAAVNSNNDMGPFSTAVTEHTPAANVQFRFMNEEIVNHGIVTITDISENEPLLCVTDSIDCCSREPGVSNGQWYFPDGSAVPDESGDNFYQASVFAAVRLHRINDMTNGIYRCDIPDTMGNNQTLHIGIYNNGAGGINLGAIQFTLTSALNEETPAFTLTLTSTGGPATTVTWERDTVELMDNDEYTISQIVVDTVQAEYSNQLTVTGRLTGDYRCMVFNIRGGAFRQLDIESTAPPTNVNATQVGLTSFTVSWTPPNPSNPTPEGYVIFFQGGDDEGSVMVDGGSATMFTVDDRINNREYSITMVALTPHLPSTVTSPETVMLFQPPTVDITPSSATAIAGQSYNLTCTVTLTMGVSRPPTIEWMGFDSGDTNITVQNVTADSGNPSMYTRTLTFMLRTSHGGDYTCQATSSAVTGMDTETLTVQLPTPILAFIRVPDADVTLRHGDALTLTCTIQLESDEVDSAVMVDGSLSGPGLAATVNSVTEISPLMYQLTGEISELEATTPTPDTYTCTVTANPGPLEMNLIASEPKTITLDVTVELLVNISVGRTDPPGFTPGDSTEYRAASGPQVVTCTVIGGVESDHSYVWTSNSSFFQTTSRTITRTAVHSGDTGTHTCTATDGAGRSGSTSVVFTIVGAGIHVFIGAPSAGSQPNNGLVISIAATTGHRFRFFCRSDSLTFGVGELIGLNENPVTDSDFIGFEDPQSGGELRLESVVGSEDVLTDDQQGIYTCRIPLQNGTVTEINIGIYPSGFATMPNITSPLVFTLEPSSSTLTCTSTGSVATTVTFMRDNTTVGPLRDGESIELSGAIYELTQTVTNRSLSTYASVLTITQDVSDVVGHTYTCMVTNVLGSATSEQLVITGIDIVGGDQPLTVGVMNIITCSTSLNISDIVWIDDMDTIVAINSEGVQQLDLVFNPVNDSIHNRMYTCTITSFASLVINGTVNITVTVPRPAITVSVNLQGSTTAGGSYTLTCTIMEEVVGLINTPSLQWLDSSGQEIVDGEGITVEKTHQNETTAILVLTFDPVRTSHGGQYSCQGTLESPPGPLMNTSEQTVTVSIPQPTVTVAVPTDPLYTGTNVTLTCNIVLNDLVDSPVIVNVAWTGPGGEISSSSRVMLLGVTESSSPFQATLTFAPLISSDGGDYTCEATVIPDDGEFITMSLPGSGTGTVAVQDLPTPQVEITPEGPSTAGMEHTLICIVTSAENLFSSPDVVWMYSNGTIIDSGDGITVGQAVTEGSVTTSILTFNPLRTSHGGMYTCMADISIPEASVAVTNDASATVNVQIPAPDITFTQSPPVDPPYAGTRFILTCTITLAQAVDTAVVVEEMWSRDTLPLNNNRTTINATRSDSANVYTTTVEISPLSSNVAEDDGDYNCSATITPQASEFVTGVTADDLQNITVRDLPQPNVTIVSMGSETAGEEYQLICTVVVVEGLVVQPTVTWIYPTNDPMNELNITVGSAQRNGVSTTLTLIFNPLRTSHRGRYTCQAGVGIPEVSIDVMGNQTFDVIVEIPPPSVTVTSSRPDPLYEGTQFFLTCNITLDEVVDLRVTVAPTWSNSSGMISNTSRTLLSSVQQTASFTYSATLTFDPLQSSDTDSYTCFVNVSFMSEFILSGENMSMEEVSVQDLPPPSVNIAVSEENPDAGEAYTLTCTATVVENLVVMPILTWTDPLNDAVAGDQDDAGTTSTLTLMFNPLRTLQGGVYTCRADIDIDAISFELSANSSQSVDVQIPQPTLAIVPNLEPAYNGTNFTLTCTITLNVAVDAPVSVVGMWMKGSDTLQTSDDTCIEVSDTTAVGTSDSMYEVTLSFNPLGNETRDEGNYTCTATVGPQQDSANAEFVRGSSNGRVYELLVDALPLPVATFSGSPDEAALNRMYTLTCSVEVVEGLAFPPIVTWMNADSMIVTENVMEQETDGTITTRDLVFSSLSVADLGVYVCEGCVTISKVFINDIDRHCGLTMPCVATETPNIDSVSCSSTSGTVLRVEWTEATATQDPCNRSGGATRYEVDVLRHVQDGNTLSTVPFNELEYPRNVEISLLETSVTGLAPGVPYQVRVAAASLGGFGNPAIENCFSRQLEPPQLTDVRAERLDAETMNVSWTPLTLVQAMGFVRYRISYQPQVNRKRQSGSVVVGGDRSFETIDGLMSGVVYDVTVEPINTDPNGQDLSAAGSPRTVVAEAEPTSGSNIAAIAGAVIGVIIAVIVIAVIIVVVIYCYRSRRYGKVSLKTERMFELTEQGKPHEASSIRPLVPSPAKEPSFVEKSVDAEPVPAPVPSVEVTDRMKPISAISFRDHVQEMHDERDKRFEAEYQSLGSDPVAPHEVAKRPYNRPKNRFANIFPYDHSRVKLKEIAGEEGSNYINACFLNGYNRENAYIASQGPMPNTVNDFWRMIWEYKLQNIVMLTKCMEAGRRKCEQYWADNMGDDFETPDKKVIVTTTSVMPFADFDIRTFSVKRTDKPDAEPLRVTQYHFTAWPDHGVPKFATSLITFIRRVQRGHNKNDGFPLLVHCSAGVGRTGTFVLLDSMLERIKSEDSVNVYEFLFNLRSKRVLMVQTLPQYVFIHDALDELITCGETDISASSLRVKVNRMQKTIPGKGITGFAEQFQLLDQVSRKPEEGDCSDALEHYNQTKNRNPERVPYNMSRARLRPTGEDGSEYINASFVDGYKRRNAYIATQAPLPNTVNDFWRMMWEFKSKTIVMLCNMVEEGLEACHPYWPSKENETTNYGSIAVTLQSKAAYGDFSIRKFNIHEEKGAASEGFVVTLFHHTEWPEHSKLASCTSLIEMIDILTKIQMNTGNRSITVMCNDGVGRTGTFITIHAQLERLKTEGVVDFFQYIKSARVHRAWLIPEVFQYAYCHEVLADYIDTFDNYANFKDMI